LQERQQLPLDDFVVVSPARVTRDHAAGGFAVRRRGWSGRRVPGGSADRGTCRAGARALAPITRIVTETDDDRGTERRPRRPGVEAPLDGVGPGEVRHLAVPAVGDPAAVEPGVLALPDRRDPDQVEAEGAGLLLDG